MKVRARKTASVLENRGEAVSRFAHLSEVASEFKAFRPAPLVLSKVRAVPTILPQFDLITRVGGLPIERVTLVHGPSAGGKTYYTIAMLFSFLLRDNPASLVDAERTTPYPWLEKAMGDWANHPFFFADRPTTYEATVENVQSFLTKIRDLRKAGKVKPETSGLVVIDSIRKLVPKDQFAKIMKDVNEAKRDPNKSNVRNRLAQIKAQMNAAWLDDLVPILEETKTAVVIIAREMVDPDAAPPRARAFGPKPEPTMKIAGGGALFYDASLDLRVSRVKSYGKESDGKFKAYGDLHKISITKSKVSGREAYKAECYFHISNGSVAPVGFDRARDLVELARRLDVIEGTHGLKYERKRWRGEEAAIKAIRDDAALFSAVEADCRAAFPKAA